MCERCGNDDCDGNGRIGVGMFNSDTGEWVPVTGERAARVPKDETAFYDQLYAQNRDVMDSILHQWNSVRPDGASDFEAVANLISALATDFEQPIKDNLLAFALVMLKEARIVGPNADKSMGMGVPFPSLADGSRRCLRCDRALEPLERCKCK